MAFRAQTAFPIMLTALIALQAGPSLAVISPAPSRTVARGSEQPPLEAGESWGAENEAQVDEIIQTTLKMLVDRSKNDTLVRRDAHPKHHGCVKAFFKVDATALSPELRTGIFAGATGAATEFAAWIRFSNGDPDGANAPDLNSDIRGMAVKLMNVEGSKSGSQDFLMCTGKEFFSKDGDDYLSLHRALAGSKLALGWYLATHLRNALNLNRARVKLGNPLQGEFFSSLPYKLGAGSMRFKVRPCANAELKDTVPGNDAATNYLRDRLVSTLATRSACFDFLVQPNRAPEKQPIENPTLSWNEKVSPYIKVATITIPTQSEIDSEAHLNFCENLSFDPWHTLPGTRPLGQIGRMRAEIYPAISEYRHQQNGIPIIEPRSHEICVGETATLCHAARRGIDAK